MKKIVLATAVTGLTAACFGQGAVDFGNFALNVNIVTTYDYIYSNQQTIVSGLAPAGSFNVALYWASAGTTIIPGTTINFTLVASGLGQPDASSDPGVFENGEVTNIPSATSPAEFIVEATEIGNLDDDSGETPAFLNAVASTTSSPPGPPPSLTGWTSDLIIGPYDVLGPPPVVPEPGTIVIVGLGAATALLFRRRK